MDKQTAMYMTARYLDTTWQTAVLANVSKQSFDKIYEDLHDRFELTVDDAKTAWKEWFDWAASNGTLISNHLLLPKNAEINLIDQLLLYAYRAIDNL